MQSERSSKHKGDLSPKEGQHSLSEIKPPISRTTLKKLVATLSISTAEELVSFNSDHPGILEKLFSNSKIDGVIASASKIARPLPHRDNCGHFPLSSVAVLNGLKIPRSLRKFIKQAT